MAKIHIPQQAIYIDYRVMIDLIVHIARHLSTSARLLGGTGTRVGPWAGGGGSEGQPFAAGWRHLHSSVVGGARRACAQAATAMDALSFCAFNIATDRTCTPGCFVASVLFQTFVASLFVQPGWGLSFFPVRALFRRPSALPARAVVVTAPRHVGNSGPPPARVQDLDVLAPGGDRWLIIRLGPPPFLSRHCRGCCRRCCCRCVLQHPQLLAPARAQHFTWTQ